MALRVAPQDKLQARLAVFQLARLPVTVLRAAWARPAGRAVLLSSGAAVLVAVAVSQLNSRKPQVSGRQQPPRTATATTATAATAATGGPQKRHAAVDGVFLRRLLVLLRIVVPSWRSRESALLVGLTGLLLLRTLLTIRMATIMGGNAKALVAGDFGRFVRGVVALGVTSVPASVVNSGLKYSTDMLSICFRQRLSRLVHQQYLSGMTYYKASALGADRLDNADQRITQDIEKWCTSVADLYATTFKPLVDVVLFTRKLSTSVGVRGPLMMYLYYFISWAVLKAYMPPFAKLTSQMQKLEGDFRFCHSRLITHAEEIAFYGGSEREKTIINRAFDGVYRHASSIHWLQALVAIFDGLLVKYGATMVGYAVVALPVFGSSLARRRAAAATATGATTTATTATAAAATESAGDRTRDYIFNTQVLINLARAIGQLVMLYKRIQTLAGYTARVSELLELLNRLHQQSGIGGASRLPPMVAGPAAVPDAATLQPPRIVTDDAMIRFENSAIVTPDGAVLLTQLNFEVRRGMNLLIAGPNGSGKSSLFRILSELWPLYCGTLTKPHKRELFYIPQRPYLPLGTFRDQLTYPDSHDDMLRRGQTDADLAQLLDAVSLSYLLERPGGWNAVADWADVLSGGEKQRVAMARLFYHRPAFAILDECTSAVAVDVEARMYQRACAAGITLLTVSHRKTLWKYHDHLLRFDGSGGYEFRPLTTAEKATE